MTDYLTLTEFMPGTKAKAQEVNANFSTLKDAINQKAAIDGDVTQKFNVAPATQTSHAVNKSQLDDLSSSLTAQINKTGTKFCVKSGNTTNGKGDLFSYNLLTVTPKIGGVYANLVFADYQGTQTTITSASTISMNGKVDGSYNIFIKPDGTFYTLSNTIYRQLARPVMLAGDVWFNTSVEPFSAIKYDGTNDIVFGDMPLGKVTLSGGTITALETFAFNQNGNNVTTQTTLKNGTNLAKSVSNLSMPDYSTAVSKNWGTTYTAESDGFVYGYIHGNSDAVNTFKINTVTAWAFGTGGGRGTFLIPVRKGDSYLATIAGGDSASLTFYPCLST